MLSCCAYLLVGGLLISMQSKPVETNNLVIHNLDVMSPSGLDKPYTSRDGSQIQLTYKLKTIRLEIAVQMGMRDKLLSGVPTLT